MNGCDETTHFISQETNEYHAIYNFHEVWISQFFFVTFLSWEIICRCYSKLKEQLFLYYYYRVLVFILKRWFLLRATVTPYEVGFLYTTLFDNGFPMAERPSLGIKNFEASLESDALIFWMSMIIVSMFIISMFFFFDGLVDSLVQLDDENGNDQPLRARRSNSVYWLHSNSESKFSRINHNKILQQYWSC